ITGVLWIDRAAAALKSLQFRFTGLEPDVLRANPGGAMQFRALANGIVLVDEWVVRTPLAVSGVSRNPAARARNRQARVTALGERGATIVSASWPDGFGWHAELGT